MEGIIRRLRGANPAADVVMMHFVDPDKMKDYGEGREPEVITNHNKVANHYNIPTINLAKEVTERIDHGEFTWEDDFKNLHPSPFGQGVYANSMIQLLERGYSGHIDADDKISSHSLPEKLDPFCYDNGSLIDISTIKLSKGWEIDPLWKPNDGTGSRANYVNVPMLISEIPGSTIGVKFNGNAVGIAVAAGHDAGTIEYRIDKGNWQKQNLFTRWSKHLHLPWYYTLASGLSAHEHKLEIRISADKAAESIGNACRIRYLFVNKP
jgi:sialidase-1